MLLVAQNFAVEGGCFWVWSDKYERN